MALLERCLVHPQPPRHRELAALQPAPHRPLHHPVHLVPGQIQLPRHRREARLVQPVDHQRLEQRREPRPRLRPGHRQRLDSVLRATNPRHLRRQDRLVLARRQVAPPAKPGVVALRCHPTCGTPERLRLAMLHLHLHLSSRQPKLHVRHPPRALYPQDPRVQVSVSHPARLTPSTRIPEEPGTSWRESVMISNR